MNNQIIVLCGKSGAGKDTLAQMLKERLGYNFVVSHTTRPMRDGESEGNPYWFIDQTTMMTMHADEELIEMRRYETEFGAWYYAVHESAIEDDKQYVVVLDIMGLMEFREHFDDRIVGIYIHVDDELREQRAKQRGGFDQAEWDRRSKDDEIVFSKEAVYRACDHVVYNQDDIEEAYEAIVDLLLS